MGHSPWKPELGFEARPGGALRAEDSWLRRRREEEQPGSGRRPRLLLGVDLIAVFALSSCPL